MKLIAIILFLFSVNGFSQEVAAPLSLNEEKFAAIVQYSNGTKEEFKELILFDKTIEVPKKAYLKVITQKRCVAVFYENTKVQTPKDKVSPWIILSGNVRWICPEDKIERVSFKDSELQIQNGEFLQTGNQLYVLRANVKSEGEGLQLDTLYTYKNKWLPLKNQPDPYDLWNKQEKYPAPLESARLKTEKPQDPYVTRVFLTVAPLGFAGLYNHELENDVSDFEMESHAFRLGTNFPWKNRSVMLFLEYNQGENKDRHESMGPPPLGFKNVRFEATTLGVGLRHSHVNSSSYYYYLGITRQEVQSHRHPTAPEYFDAKIVYPYNLSIGGGYQKIFWAKSWISLVLGFDFKIIQSLSQGEIEWENQSISPRIDQRSMLTEYAGLVYLGPVFNF